MGVDPALLAGVELFRVLPDDVRDRVVADAQVRSMKRGDVLFRTGDEASELFIVERGRLAMTNRSPDGRESVVALLTKRLRAMDEVLADSVFLDVTGRTAKRLLELAGEADEFQLPITQEELAGLVGASRERVNKAISSFVRLGWVANSGGGRYRITNREQLDRRSR